jgi:hypothetical protein
MFARWFAVVCAKAARRRLKGRVPIETRSDSLSRVNLSLLAGGWRPLQLPDPGRAIHPILESGPAALVQNNRARPLRRVSQRSDIAAWDDVARPGYRCHRGANESLQSIASPPPASGHEARQNDRPRAACNLSENAASVATDQQLVLVTHPFHPLFGRQLPCVGRRGNGNAPP